MKRGDCLGEVALLYNAPRSGSIKALETGWIWGIDGKIFKKVLRDLSSKEKSENLFFLDRINFLSNLEMY